MSKLFCLCADDFALTESISESILTLLTAQRIQATSCMTQSPLWTTYSRELKLLTIPTQIGLHFNLTQPFDGHFNLPLKTLMIKAWTHKLDCHAIVYSLEQQWQAFVDNMGRAPDFIDGHQHVHQFPIVRELLLGFLKEHHYQGWVRNLANTLLTPHNLFKTWLLPHLGATQLKAHCEMLGINHNQQFAGIYDFGVIIPYASYMQAWMKNALEHSTTLLMCHPSLSHRHAIDPIAIARTQEFAYLNSRNFIEDCERFDIQLGLIR